MLDKITKPLKILSTLGLVVAGYTLDSGPCQADWYTCWSSNSCCKGWMSETRRQHVVNGRVRLGITQVAIIPASISVETIKAANYVPLPINLFAAARASSVISSPASMRATSSHRSP